MRSRRGKSPRNGTKCRFGLPHAQAQAPACEQSCELHHPTQLSSARVQSIDLQVVDSASWPNKNRRRLVPFHVLPEPRDLFEARHRHPLRAPLGHLLPLHVPIADRLGRLASQAQIAECSAQLVRLALSRHPGAWPPRKTVYPCRNTFAPQR